MTNNLSRILPDIDSLEEEFSMLEDFEEIESSQENNQAQDILREPEDIESETLELVETSTSMAKKHPLNIKIDNILKDFNFIRSEVHSLTKQSKALMKIVMDQIEEEEGIVSGAILLSFSQMNSSIGNNLKLLITLYEKVIKISSDYKKLNKEEELAKVDEIPQQVNNGTINNIYASSSSDLLNMIKQIEKQKS